MKVGMDNNLSCDYNDEELEELWESFADVPVIDDYIDLPFLRWEEGTPYITILSWFDKNHSKGVDYLIETYGQ